jgi:hypothetical protein
MITVRDELFNFTTDFSAAGQDAIALVIQCVLHYEGIQLNEIEPADDRISSAELPYIPCRSCCDQGTSPLTRIELDPGPPSTLDN